MSNLARLILSRAKHQCDLCALSLFLNVLQFGLIMALHLKG